MGFITRRKGVLHDSEREQNRGELDSGRQPASVRRNRSALESYRVIAVIPIRYLELVAQNSRINTRLPNLTTLTP